jgi:hypothetical protein
VRACVQSDFRSFLAGFAKAKNGELIGCYFPRLRECVTDV